MLNFVYLPYNMFSVAVGATIHYKIADISNIGWDNDDLPVNHVHTAKQLIIPFYYASRL